MTTAADPMTLIAQFADTSWRADPFPLYRRLADEFGDFAGDNFFLATSYSAASQVLRDDRFGNAPTDDTIFLAMNPPEHTRMRRFVTKPFSPTAVQKWASRIDALVSDLLDKAEERGTLDVVGDVAYPTPLTVICELLGAPEEDHDDLRRWSRAIAPTLDPFPLQPDLAKAAQEAEDEFRTWAAALAQRRAAHPGDDLLSQLVVQQAAGALNERELTGTCLLLLFAGHETTVNLISAGVLALLQDGTAWDRIAEDPSLAPAAVDELMRYLSPVQYTSRSALADASINGTSLVKGTEVFLLIAAANRDPAEFDHPDRLDLDRPNNHHLGFGLGIHHCLGAPLAKLEAQVAITNLARRYPRLHLIDGDPPTWRPTLTLRGLERLPVAV